MSNDVAFAPLAVPVLAGLSVPAMADVKPNPLFSEGAVLQRGKPVPVWGTADDGETVTVKIQDQTATATAGKDGQWMVKLGELTSRLRAMHSQYPGLVVAVNGDSDASYQTVMSAMLAVQSAGVEMRAGVRMR